ncbi:DUF998 domain-containing protein [Lysobacter sp.]|uniref:DUF998 domain-containing protein n=1 Tax=Lysobacter sp. TaxID=72226 RepID=UPI002D6EC586|nr:DUF998 domain-containing protein [Lysobacter sp.]HZX78789.1 DUF998 domain-containing protein [Lysobacter sp.]
MNRSPALVSFDRHAGWLAALCCVLAVLGFAAALPDFSHRQHPPALLGAHGIPHALAFNLLAFVVPGLLAAWLYARLRDRLPPHAGRRAAVGAWMLVISALAFAAQGLWPLDPAELDGAISQRHTAAWLLWWLAFAPGALLLGAGLYRRAPSRGVAIAFLAAGALTVLLNLLPTSWLPGPIAQRLVMLLWLACLAMASRVR